MSLFQRDINRKTTHVTRPAVVTTDSSYLPAGAQAARCSGSCLTVPAAAPTTADLIQGHLYHKLTSNSLWVLLQTEAVSMAL